MTCVLICYIHRKRREAAKTLKEERSDFDGIASDKDYEKARFEQVPEVVDTENIAVLPRVEQELTIVKRVSSSIRKSKIVEADISMTPLSVRNSEHSDVHEDNVSQQEVSANPAQPQNEANSDIAMSDDEQ
jgi:hypothetical protein